MFEAESITNKEEEKMTTQNIETILKEKEIPYQILEFSSPFESTYHAAEVIKTPVEYIAKTLAFQAPFGVIVIIAPGTAKVDNKKFKNKFEVRPLMLKPDQLKELTGFEPGCVSPIGISSDKIKVYMDVSLKNLTQGLVYPSCGTDRSAIGISSADLYIAADCVGIVDVCK